jgi:hypothetical protein
MYKLVLAQNNLETHGDSCEFIERFSPHLAKLLVERQRSSKNNVKG